LLKSLYFVTYFRGDALPREIETLWRHIGRSPRNVVPALRFLETKGLEDTSSAAAMSTYCLTAKRVCLYLARAVGLGGGARNVSSPLYSSPFSPPTADSLVGGLILLKPCNQPMRRSGFKAAVCVLYRCYRFHLNYRTAALLCGAATVHRPACVRHFAPRLGGGLPTRGGEPFGGGGQRRRRRRGARRVGAWRERGESDHGRKRRPR
jgi:hypothetical protein